MKVLVVPGSDVVGGSEINAVDLAAGVRDRGHEVVVYAKPGPVSELARDRRLRVTTAHHPSRARPSPIAVQDLRRVVRRERPDLVHAYEGYSTTEAFYAVGLAERTPMVGTVYTMFVDTYLPSCFPMILGTEAMRREQTSRRTAPVHVLEPPVDVHAALSGDGAAFRRLHGIGDNIFLAVMVSRLDVEQKFGALQDAIIAMSMLDDVEGMEKHLVIVGDGPARGLLEGLADRLAPGRVTFTGRLADPRSAHLAADVVLGMGTSVLRGMATAKPSIVVSERGHVQLISPSTIDLYLEQGFWGVGPDTGGPQRLLAALRDVENLGTERRDALGRFGRELAVERFGLPSTAARLELIYIACSARRTPTGPLVRDALITLPQILRFKVRHRMPTARRRARLAGAGPDLPDHLERRAPASGLRARGDA